MIRRKQLLEIGSPEDLNIIKKIIIEILEEETGLSHSFFQNASMIEVENQLGIPHYQMSGHSSRRSSYLPFHKRGHINEIDEQILLDY